MHAIIVPQIKPTHRTGVDCLKKMSTAPAMTMPVETHFGISKMYIDYKR